MNREHGLRNLPTTRPRQPRATSGAALPVLIEVPALPANRRGRARGGLGARSQPGNGARRPRRRLRREVRMAGYGLLLLLTTGGLFRGAWSVAAPPGGGVAEVAEAPPPSISISIEPAALAPCAEAASPVVFPGYLLPDDGCEEPAHAGS